MQKSLRFGGFFLRFFSRTKSLLFFYLMFPDGKGQ